MSKYFTVGYGIFLPTCLTVDDVGSISLQCPFERILDVSSMHAS